ncbi:4-hydroxybenzoate polyprenyltransferase, mitochondrial-like [Bidens hawaiensis]|uniref:4-hydroxybenzoate polyprenyltransferase, mitochondrial-like n=1 Tax=Bidens hawaiensis TaxID=980011 RepID=UPI00404AE6E3
MYVSRGSLWKNLSVLGTEVRLAYIPPSPDPVYSIAIYGIFWFFFLFLAFAIQNNDLSFYLTQVERTKSRPIASGALTPFQRISFLGIQLLLGLGILLQLNNYSIVLGASSLLLVFTYPLMKRITFWPQAFLGLTFNWGALLGWSAIRGSLDPAIVLPLYLSGVCWTLVYLSVTCIQDKEDDKIVGVKSTALRFGDSTKIWVSGFGIACISGLALSGFNANLGLPYYVFLAAASGQLAWQIWAVDIYSSSDCRRKFVSNKWFGALVFGGILMGRLSS